MRLIIILLFFFPIFAFGQVMSDQANIYYDLARYQLQKVRGNVKYMHVIDYSSVYIRQQENTVQINYPSGNLRTRTNSNFIYHFLDNKKLQVDSVYQFDGFGKTRLVSTSTFNKFGIEKSISYDPGFPDKINLNTYDVDGRLLENKMMQNNQVEYDYVYSYDDEGRKRKEVHVGSGDEIYFAYDYRGRKVQEVEQQNNGATTRRVLQYTYDDNDNMVQMQNILGEANLMESRYKYDSVGQKVEMTNTDQQGYSNGKEIFTYDKWGNLKDEISLSTGYQGEFWFDTTGNTIKSMEKYDRFVINQTYEYNTRKNLLSVKLGNVNAIGSYNRPSTTDYEYDSVGNLLIIRSPQTKTVFTYNKKCKAPTESLVYTYIGFLIAHHFFMYDQNCQLSKKLSYVYYGWSDVGPNHPTDTITTDFYYDSNNRLLEEGSLSTGLFNYSLKLNYNQYGLAAASLTEKVRNDQGALIKEYIFNEKGDLVEMKINSFPETNTYTYIYDDRGNWIKRFNKKIKGKQPVKEEVVERVIRYN